MSTPPLGPARTYHPMRRPPVLPKNQAGVVLVVGLIMLVVVTMLAISSLRTTAVDQRMAGNLQEAYRSFQGAETGLATAFADPNAFNVTQGLSGGVSTIGTYSASVAYNTVFRGYANPPVLESDLYSATKFQAAHFDVTSSGATVTDASTVLHGGVYQIAPRL